MFTKVEADWAFTGAEIVVLCHNERDARTRLRTEFKYWSEMAARFGVPALLQYKYRGQKKWFRILAAESTEETKIAPMLTINESAIAQVYSSPILPCSKQLLSVMSRMIESERPMFATINNGADEDRQVWLNQLACDLIKSSGQDAIQRSMKDYVSGEDLDRMHQRLRDSSPGQVFEHSYRARLNDNPEDGWMSAVGRYEIIEVGTRSLRLSTTIDFKLIGRPDLVTFR